MFHEIVNANSCPVAQVQTSMPHPGLGIGEAGGHVQDQWVGVGLLAIAHRLPRRVLVVMSEAPQRPVFLDHTFGSRAQVVECLPVQNTIREMARVSGWHAGSRPGVNVRVGTPGSVRPCRCTIQLNMLSALVPCVEFAGCSICTVQLHA